MLAAIFPAGTRDVPDEITPDYVVQQPLLLEHARGAVYALVMRWLSGRMPLPRAAMHLGTIESLKTAVASNLGMSIVPDVAVAQPSPDIIVRPLRPPVPCTLALIEHHNKPNEPALEIVRNALLALREDGEANPHPATARALLRASETATPVAPQRGRACAAEDQAGPSRCARPPLIWSCRP